MPSVIVELGDIATERQTPEALWGSLGQRWQELPRVTSGTWGEGNMVLIFSNPQYLFSAPDPAARQLSSLLLTAWKQGQGGKILLRAGEPGVRARITRGR